MKPAAQEVSLKDIQKHPTIYGGKAPDFKIQTRIKEVPNIYHSNFLSSSGGQRLTKVCDAL